MGRAANAFSHRSAGFATDAERGLPVLVRKGSERAWGLATAPGPAQTRDGVCVGVAFRIRALRRRPKRVLSRLHTQPARAAVNASPTASRPPTHDSGSGWFAIPFLCGSCIRSFPPVYPGARSVPYSLSIPSYSLWVSHVYKDEGTSKRLLYMMRDSISTRSCSPVEASGCSWLLRLAIKLPSHAQLSAMLLICSPCTRLAPPRIAEAT